MRRKKKLRSIRRGEQSQAGGIESKIRHPLAPGSKTFGTKRDYNRNEEKQKFKRWVEGEYEEGE